MKVTGIRALTMKERTNITITPYSIPGNSNYPTPIIYRNKINNAKAEMKRVKLTGCIKLSRRQVRAMPLLDLVDININPNIKFGNWRWDN